MGQRWPSNLSWIRVNGMATWITTPSMQQCRTHIELSCRSSYPVKIRSYNYQTWKKCLLFVGSWICLFQMFLNSAQNGKFDHTPWCIQVSGYDVIRWTFGTKNKGKLICNSPNDILSGNFDSEKVDQNGIFYYKEILHFFFEWPHSRTQSPSYARCDEGLWPNPKPDTIKTW
jgi:hypothetical protein